jgi:hypothetical protein
MMAAETERQRDQRIADELRAERAADAERASRRAAFCKTHGAWWADGCDACRDDLGELAEVLA